MTTWKHLKDNPGDWRRYFLREKILKATRAHFDALGFHEVETPILISHPPAESYLEIFETTLLDRNRNPSRAFLSTSPETALKKLLVAGIGNCYSLTKSFRNMETGSDLHNPEFSLLEWYRVGADYTDIMSDCEDLLCNLVVSVGKDPDGFVFRGRTISVRKPWKRLSVAEAFSEYSGIDFLRFLEKDEAVRVARKKGYAVEVHTTWEELFNQIFLNEIEPKLGLDSPVILYDYPSAMGALARKKPTDTRFAERFEFYIGGLELGDCYSELTDWKEQKERFDAEMAEIRRLGKTAYPYDEDFIVALKEGLPACSGVAVGMDRIIMLLSDAASIADTMLFPGRDMF